MLTIPSPEIKARYRFQQYLFERGFRNVTVNVLIVSQSPKRYKIKLLAPNVNGHNVGDEIWVNKASVTIPPAPEDYTDAWWNNN